MSWRETIEGKIYLYGKELAARDPCEQPSHGARVRCNRLRRFSGEPARSRDFWLREGSLHRAVTASEICLMEMADIRTRFLDEESTDQAPGKADARPLAIGRMK
jgi:hypothetical protein